MSAVASTRRIGSLHGNIRRAGGIGERRPSLSFAAGRAGLADIRPPRHAVPTLGRGALRLTDRTAKRSSPIHRPAGVEAPPKLRTDVSAELVLIEHLGSRALQLDAVPAGQRGRLRRWGGQRAQSDDDTYCRALNDPRDTARCQAHLGSSESRHHVPRAVGSPVRLAEPSEPKINTSSSFASEITRRSPDTPPR